MLLKIFVKIEIFQKEMMKILLVVNLLLHFLVKIQDKLLFLIDKQKIFITAYKVGKSSTDSIKFIHYIGEN